MSPRRANFLLLSVGAVWGMGFVAQETAMEHIGPMLFIGLRFLLAGLVVLPFAIVEWKKVPHKFSINIIIRLLPVGFVFFSGAALQQVGLLGTTVTNAGFLTALYVVFVPFILLTVLGEKQTNVIWFAAFLALVGVYFIGGGNLNLLDWGDFLIILSAFFWAVHVILIGKLGSTLGIPVTMSALQFLVCGMLGIAGYWLMLTFGSGEFVASWEVIWPAFPEIVYTGIVAGGLAFTLQAIGQQYTSEGSAAVLLSSESLFAALFGALFLGERIGYAGYLGCGLIFIAMLMVELKRPPQV